LVRFFWRSNCEAHHEFLNGNKRGMSKKNEERTTSLMSIKKLASRQKERE